MDGHPRRGTPDPRTAEHHPRLAGTPWSQGPPLPQARRHLRRPQLLAEGHHRRVESGAGPHGRTAAPAHRTTGNHRNSPHVTPAAALIPSPNGRFSPDALRTVLDATQRGMITFHE